MTYDAKGLLALAGQKAAQAALTPDASQSLDFDFKDEVITGSATIDGIDVTIKLSDVNAMRLLGLVAEALNDGATPPEEPKAEEPKPKPARQPAKRTADRVKEAMEAEKAAKAAAAAEAPAEPEPPAKEPEPAKPEPETPEQEDTEPVAPSAPPSARRQHSPNVDPDSDDF